jgi:hypothetical protein
MGMLSNSLHKPTLEDAKLTLTLVYLVLQFDKVTTL